MRSLLLTTFLTLSLSLSLLKCRPAEAGRQTIKYQAVARDSMGSIMTNANITVRVSILDPESFGTAGGGVVHSEIHKTGDYSLN